MAYPSANNDNNANTLSAYIKEDIKQTGDWYRRRPGFFTPFLSPLDAVTAIFAPVLAPISLAALALFHGIVAAIATIGCVGNALFAISAYCFNKELAEDTMYTAISYAVTAFISIVSAFLYPIHALVACPVTAIQLATRTLATVANQFECCVSEKDDEFASNDFYCV